MATTNIPVRDAALPLKCAQCEALQQAPLACVDCHDLLAHVQGADYFELFGLPRSYAIDPAGLNRAYVAITRNIHPDRFARDGAQMQSFALRASAAVNKAHEVLSDPIRRAEYLLETAGGKSASQDKRVPQAFLAETMMLRESIEDAKAEGESQLLATLRSRVSVAKEATERKIAGLCDHLSDGGDAVKEELRQTLNTYKYHANLAAQFDGTAENV